MTGAHPRWLTLVKSKLHKLRVTDAELDYHGSIGLDGALMEAAHIVPGEQVHVWNLTNGQRLITYAIREPLGCRRVKINGAAARLCAPGDVVILATFVQVAEEDAGSHEPTIVLVDDRTNTLTGEPPA